LGLNNLRERFYAPEGRFTEQLDQGSFADLPRHTVEGWNASRDRRCALVNEDHRMSANPTTSHFNLLSPNEEQGLRGPDGCLWWCLDVQDWRWSSRGVRDRAVRMLALFELTPTAVIEEPQSGYGCLLLQVGARRSGSGPGSSEPTAKLVLGTPGW